MKAGQITALGRVEIVDAGRSRPLADGEVIVAPETGCLCGSDIPYFSEAHDRYPLAVGLSLHEIVGRVIDSSSRTFQAGDRVLAMPLGLRGLFEHLTIGEDRLVRIEPGLDNDAAVLAQPMATVLSALSTLPGLIGSTVAIVGQGPIGLLFNACVASLGAARIIGIDVLERRAARGGEFGATDSICAGHGDPVGPSASSLGGRWRMWWSRRSATRSRRSISASSCAVTAAGCCTSVCRPNEYTTWPGTRHSERA